MMDCRSWILHDGSSITISFLLNDFLWIFTYLRFSLILIRSFLATLNTLIIGTQHIIDSSIPIKISLWRWINITLVWNCSCGHRLTCCLATPKLERFLFRTFLATSTSDDRRCKVCVLVVLILNFSIAILTRNRNTCLLQKLLMTWHLSNLLIRHWLLWLTWPSSLAQDVAIDTWNCCWKHVLHYSFVSSRLYLSDGHSARTQGVRRCLFGLLREKRHHFIHFLIINDRLLTLAVRIFIVPSWRTVVGKLWFISWSSCRFDRLNIDADLFT